MTITCPRCGMVSANPNDAREGYCGSCHDWTDEKAEFLRDLLKRAQLRYYTPEGAPMEDVLEWAKRFENMDRKVAHTQVGDAEVSTVYLGLDHNYSGEGPPIIFETMIFGGEHDMDQWRYPTKEAALAGHDQVVTALQRGEEPA